MSTRETVQRSAAIMHANRERQIAIVAAPGELQEALPGDTDGLTQLSVTSLLQDIYRLNSRGKSFEAQFDAVRSRFKSIGEGLEETSFIDKKMSDLYRGIDREESMAWVVSRGEAYMMDIFAKESGGSPADAANYIIAKNGTYTFVGGELPRVNSEFDVMGGYYGADEYGNIELFPSPGANYTASIVAVGVEAKRLEIYKEVPGYFSADPQIVTNPHHIEEITYEQMRAINWASEKPVIPRDSVLPAIKSDIPLYVASVEQPEHGTIIRKSTNHDGKEPVVGVFGRGSMTSFTVEIAGRHDADGIAKKILEVFSRENRSVRAAKTDMDRVSVDVEKDQLAEATGTRIEDSLSSIGKLQVHEENASITVVPDNKRGLMAVIAKTAKTLEEANIEASEFTANKNVIFTVEGDRLEPAVRAIHDAFFSDNRAQEGQH